MNEVGVGIIGFGLATRVFHAPFISAVPGLSLRTIVQRRGDEAKSAYPHVRIERNVEAMLADPAIQMVVVATPNETHFDLAGQALSAGKHVVIDKPFAATSAQARQLIELAEEKKLVVAPFHNRRWDGDFLTVRKLLQAGTLGRLVTFESHFDRFRPIPRENTWKEAANPANGMLFDLGPHLVDQCFALFGAPRTVTAAVCSDRDATEIEDSFDIVLGYDRMRAWCRASMIAADAAPRFLLHGTSGSYRKTGVDPQEPALVAGAKVPRIGDPQVWFEEVEEAWGTLTVAPVPADPANKVVTQLKTERGDYRGFYANIRDVISGSASLAVPPETAHDVLRVLELARVSSSEGRTVAFA